MSSTLKNLYSAPSRRLLKFLKHTKLTEDTFIIILAFFIGIIVGLAAVGMKFLIDQVSFFFFPGNGSIQENISNTSWYLRLLLPVVGALAIAPIIYYFSPEARGLGFYEVINSILFKGGKMNPRIVVTKTLTNTISVSTGSSVGIETPIIQVGAGIGSTIGQLFKLTDKRLKTIAACGTAAAIAAIFNAPVAGAVFVVEVIVLDIAFSQFSAIFTASLMGAVTRELVIGKFSRFIIPSFSLNSYYELFFYLLLGIICGFCSLLFIRSLKFSDTFFNNIKIHPMIKPALGGLIVGFIGIFYPQVLGIGYDSINLLFTSNTIVWYSLLIIVLLKALATFLSLGSGSSGGTLSPTIFIGAFAGYLFGMVINYYFPNSNTSPLCYALVGIAGFISGTTRAPITAIIILFELSGNINIVLPLFVTSVISFITATKFCKDSVFTFKLCMQNKKMRNGIDINLTQKLKVDRVYSKSFEAISISDNFNYIINQILKYKKTIFPVIDSRGIIKGVIISTDIKNSVDERNSLQQLLMAGDIAITEYETVTLEDDCNKALTIMNKYDLDGLPVIELQHNKVVGMLWKEDIIKAYLEEVDTIDLANELADNFDLKNEYNLLHTRVGFAITEIVPPIFIVGKSINSLNLYNKYGLNLLAIKSNVKNDNKIIPNPDGDYIIQEKDSIVIAGETKNIQMFVNLK